MESIAETGVTLTEQAGRPPADPPIGAVTFDTPCRACGYSLRWAAADGRCPECGLEVAASLQGDILARWDPADVRRKATAMRVVLWATLAFILVDLAETLVNGWVPVPDVASLVRRVRVQVAFDVAAALALAAAHWRLGAPPSHAGAAKVAWRRFYRVTTILVLSLMLIAMVQTVVTAGRPPAPPTGGTRALRLAQGVGMIVLIAAGYLGFFGYVRELARRIPRDGLAQAATWLTWVCVAALLGYAALMIAVNVWQPMTAPSRRLLLAQIVAVAVTGILFLAGTAGAAVLLHRLRVHFTRAANRAAPPPGPAAT